MIGLDTNVILRYVTQDDPVQSRIATKLMDKLSAEEPGYVSMILVVELVWVLQKSYNSGRQEIAAVVESLLRTKELTVERAELVSQAVRLFAEGRADFADALIERCADAANCNYTLTFDKAAAAAAGMRLLS